MYSYRLGAVFFLSIALLSSRSMGASPSDLTRLRLMVTHSVEGGGGSSCFEASGTARKPPSRTLGEGDVIAFRPQGNLIVLDPARVKGRRDGNTLVDHCYELWIENKEVSRGIILWTDSPVLTGQPTLIVTEGETGLELQFLSGNHGNYRPILDVELKAVFEGKPAPVRRRQ